MCFWPKRCRAGHVAPPSSEALNWTGVCVRSALVHRFLKPHAGPRLGGLPALATTDSTTSAALLTLKGRSGASPHQFRAKAPGYSVSPFHGQKARPRPITHHPSPITNHQSPITNQPITFHLSPFDTERLLRASLLPPPLPRRRYSRLQREQSRSGY